MRKTFKLVVEFTKPKGSEIDQIKESLLEVMSDLFVGTTESCYATTEDGEEDMEFEVVEIS